MASSLAFNPGFSEAEMFLASLQSSDSSDGDKSDYYSLSNNDRSPGYSANGYGYNNGNSTSTGNGVWADRSSSSGGVNLTPESFHELPLSSQPSQQQMQLAPQQQQHQQQQQQQQQQPESGALTVGSDFSGPIKIKTDESPGLSFEADELRDLLAPEGTRDSLDSLEPYHESSHSKVFKPKRERTSHNVIEKKYRTNINDKILQLRDIVPSLRCAAKREMGQVVALEDQEELDGLEPARKLNKASVLIKTIEYIRHLENKCDTYKFENTKLKAGQGFTTPESERNVSTGNNDFMLNLSADQPQSSPYAQAYPTRPKDASSKYLMAGLAATMGASCFGDTSDFKNAKSLMSMPVIHYSQAGGFTFSNANGVINMPTVFLSLLRITLLFATAIHFLRLLTYRGEDKKDKTHDLTVVQFADTVCFRDPSQILDTLKKTMILNRLKYPINSIERIESEIANCFALKFYQFSFPLNIWTKRHTDATWLRIRKQVELANAKTGGALKNGFEWEMIINVLASSRKDTLDSAELKDAIINQGVFTLKELVEFVNGFMVKYRSETVVINLLEEVSCAESKVNDVIEKVYEAEVFNNSALQLSSEISTTLCSLFETTENNIDALLKLVKNRSASQDSNKQLDNDQILVLYSSIVRNLISSGQYKSAYHWASKIPPNLVISQEVSVIGVAAVILMLKCLFEKENHEDLQVIFPRLESLSGKVRVWLGNAANSSLGFELRGKLIDFCVDTAVICGSVTMKQLEEDTEVESQSEELSDDDGSS
ncbi:LANO_0B04500g1_1 [Lachancea nothofagi CBS 11611]|uniref:LANO_0B04500g1_1 n=1 Tax=Lachancea nothofagi CBS 11611 TaxID=1266666 RepID=A0A1G4IXT5_9SACH|nr:LANO_0B04500g1_1 [Lachancea nothofagi CBS 11611]